MADIKSFMIKCFFCETDFQFGPHRYDGRHLRHLQFEVCETCIKANWDGLAPRYEKKFLKHLKEQKLSVPERNERGFIVL